MFYRTRFERGEQIRSANACRIEDRRRRKEPPGTVALRGIERLGPGRISNRDTKLLEFTVTFTKQRTAPQSNRDKNVLFSSHILGR
jgi:hypothetical protein